MMSTDSIDEYLAASQDDEYQIKPLSSKHTLNNMNPRDNRDLDLETFRSIEESYQLFTRQDTFESILFGKPLEKKKLWKDSIIKFSPIGEKRRVVLTESLSQRLQKYKTWLNIPTKD